MEDGKNCYILNFDCSNVNDIAKKIAQIPKEKVKLPEDIYGKLLASSKSTYEQQLDSRWLVEATNKYMATGTSDNELANQEEKERYVPAPGKQWEVSYKRKEILYHAGFVNVIKEVKGEKECITESKKTKEKNCKKEEHFSI